MEQTPKTPPPLSEQDIADINYITSQTDVVPKEIRDRAAADILKVLENNHPLNKIWRNDGGKIIGYLGFEDFSPSEAYVKYFATEGFPTENPFSVISNLIEQAKNMGYTKIHFHGFNKRLNKVLTHFGFQKTQTDEALGYTADHFELRIEPTKSVEVQEKTREAFEQKYTSHLIQEIEKTVYTLKADRKEQLSSAESDLVQKLSSEPDFELTEKKKLILKLKLARYLQRHETVDTNTLFDAIMESPKWLDKDKGGFDGLLEVHEQKTLLKIAEMRRKKAEQTGQESFNPYEALFETASGKYYLARLLNMPHLEEESQYMGHCVGTSDSYISKMKKGEAEILSIRDTKNHEPILTIEYFPKTHVINQIKGPGDEYLTGKEKYVSDVLEILKRMKETTTDAGEDRKVAEINSSELENFKVKDYHILTESGEVSLRDFMPGSDVFVLKMGEMSITPEVSKDDQAKIIKIFANIDVTPSEISNSADELTENTTLYIGPWNPTTYEKIRLHPNIKHIYEEFPSQKAFLRSIETDPQIRDAKQAEQIITSKGFETYDTSKDILSKIEFSQEQKEYKLISFSVEQLGFSNGATIQEIYTKAKEQGLELCPAEVGPFLRSQYLDQMDGEFLAIAMNALLDSGGRPRLFCVIRDGGRSWLGTTWIDPSIIWSPVSRFVFIRKT